VFFIFLFIDPAFSPLPKRFPFPYSLNLASLSPSPILLLVPHNWVVFVPISIKGQPGALILPHTQGSRRGPTIWGLYATLPYCFTQEAVFCPHIYRFTKWLDLFFTTSGFISWLKCQLCLFLFIIDFDFQVFFFFFFVDPPLQSHITFACEDFE
jgi:hypothetical protein